MTSIQTIEAARAELAGHGCCKRSRRALPDVKPTRIRREATMDITTLTQLLREAKKHHSPYEATAPKHDWSAWYAAYIVARDHGRTPEEAAGDAGLHLSRAQAQGAMSA
jgi:hypothetical protein